MELRKRKAHREMVGENSSARQKYERNLMRSGVAEWARYLIKKGKYEQCGDLLRTHPHAPRARVVLEERFEPGTGLVLSYIAWKNGERKPFRGRVGKMPERLREAYQNLRDELEGHYHPRTIGTLFGSARAGRLLLERIPVEDIATYFRVLAFDRRLISTLKYCRARALNGDHFTISALNSLDSRLP